MAVEPLMKDMLADKALLMSCNSPEEFKSKWKKTWYINYGYFDRYFWSIKHNPNTDFIRGLYIPEKKKASDFFEPIGLWCPMHQERGKPNRNEYVYLSTLTRLEIQHNLPEGRNHYWLKPQKWFNNWLITAGFEPHTRGLGSIRFDWSNTDGQLMIHIDGTMICHNWVTLINEFDIVEWLSTSELVKK